MMNGRRMTDPRNCGQSSFDVVPRNNPCVLPAIRQLALCPFVAGPPLTWGTSEHECSPQSASLVILIALVVMVVATISADAAAEYNRYVAQRVAARRRSPHKNVLFTPTTENR